MHSLRRYLDMLYSNVLYSTISHSQVGLLSIMQVHHIYTEDQLKQIEKHEVQQAADKGVDLSAVDASRSGAHCVTGPSAHTHHHHFHSKNRSSHFVNLERLVKH